VIESQTFSEASDWFAFGCLLYEMAVGRQPFSGISVFQIKSNIMNTQPVYPNWLDKDLKDLIVGLLNKKPSDRISNAGELISNPFFKDIDFDKMRDPAQREKLAPSKPILEYDSDTFYFEKSFKGLNRFSSNTSNSKYKIKI